MRATAFLLVLVAGCYTTPSPTSAPPQPPAASRSTATCGTRSCSATEICIPGGTSRNGIGETVQLAPEHCAPLPAACNGVATCTCVEKLCPIGGCASIDAGRLVCLAG